MTATHTPTPWNTGAFARRIFGKNDETIAFCSSRGISADQQAIDIKHAIRCVNAHDRLVAALRADVRAMEAHNRDQPDCDYDFLSALESARALLAELDKGRCGL